MENFEITDRGIKYFNEKEKHIKTIPLRYQHLSNEMRNVLTSFDKGKRLSIRERMWLEWGLIGRHLENISVKELYNSVNPVKIRRVNVRNYIGYYEIETDKQGVTFRLPEGFNYNTGITSINRVC